jgi:hypothetical protein
MELQNNLYNRYPGLKSFDEGESTKFFGRELETGELLNNILTEQLMLLFSKSGVGKSSLLNAGIIPRLKKRGYYPLKIRFQLSNNSDNQEEITPLSILKSNLRNEELNFQGEVLFEEDKILYNKETPNLWEYMKVMKFPENKIPVLIFDQFEEFFSYSDKMQHEFLKQLAELLHSQPPNRIINWIGSIDMESRTTEQIEWIKQPQVKFVFAIRDDRLSELDSFKTFIPLILKNRYKLNPLSFKNAQEAIEGPASMDDNETFKVRKFSYNQTVVQRILDKLQGLKNTGDGAAKNAGIDGSQLQKVCSFIERKVIEAQQHTTQTIVVDDKFLDVERDVQLIIDNFYTEQINLFFTGAEVEKVKDIIEEHFVVEQSRVFVLASQLRAWANYDTQLIQRMLNARLIKEEHIHLGKGYELSHDTLVPSVIKSKAEKDRRLEEEKNRLEWESKQKELEKIAQIEKKRKRMVFYFSTAFILLITVFFLLFLDEKIKESKKSTANLSKIYNYEARIQFGNGNLIYANFLAELIRYNNSKDSNLVAQFKKTQVFPFSGREVKVSDDEKMIGTLWEKGRLNIWSVENEDSVYSLLDVDSVKKFSFCRGNNSIWVVKEAGDFFFYRFSAESFKLVQIPGLKKLIGPNKVQSGDLDHSNQFFWINTVDSLGEVHPIFLNYPSLRIWEKLTKSVEKLFTESLYEDFYFSNFLFKNLDDEHILFMSYSGRFFKIHKESGVVKPSVANQYISKRGVMGTIGNLGKLGAFVDRGILRIFDLAKDALIAQVNVKPYHLDDLGDIQFVCADTKIWLGEDHLYNISQKTFSKIRMASLVYNNNLFIELSNEGVITIYNNQTGSPQISLPGVNDFDGDGGVLEISYNNNTDSIMNLNTFTNIVLPVKDNDYELVLVIGNQYYMSHNKKTRRKVITYINNRRPNTKTLIKNFKPFIQTEYGKFGIKEEKNLIDKVIKNIKD